MSLCPWDGWESVTVSVGWVGECHCVRGMGEQVSLCLWYGWVSVCGMGGRVSLCLWDGWVSVTVSVGWVGECHYVCGMGGWVTGVLV